MLLALLCGLSAPLALADTVQFSAASSDSTPAADLDAVIAYSLAGDTLKLQIANLTAAPSAFAVTELRFNVSANVAGLVFAPSAPAGPTFGTATGGKGGFGSFDYALSFGNGVNGALPAGQTATFSFDATPVSGTTLTTLDFFTPQGGSGANSAVSAILHFQSGPNGDSAWGSGLIVPPGGSSPPIVPEPATVTLLGLGLAGIAYRRRARQ
jgi:hypothetical protein